MNGLDVLNRNFEPVKLPLLHWSLVCVAFAAVFHVDFLYGVLLGFAWNVMAGVLRR